MPASLPAVALTVAIIYYQWRDSYLARLHDEQATRTRVLRERVAYMLWTAAQTIA
jgi:hypothetical protein